MPVSKTLYRRREFLEPMGTGQTAYVYAYLEDYFNPREKDSKGQPRKRHRRDFDAEFGFHGGNETIHLHFEWGRDGKIVRGDLMKLRKLAKIANEFADKLEKARVTIE